MTTANLFEPPAGMEDTSLRLIPHVLRPCRRWRRRCSRPSCWRSGAGRYTSTATPTSAAVAASPQRQWSLPPTAPAARRGSSTRCLLVASLRGAAVGGLRRLAAGADRAGAAGLRGRGRTWIRLHDAVAPDRGGTGKRADGLLRGEARPRGRPRPAGGGAAAGRRERVGSARSGAGSARATRAGVAGTAGGRPRGRPRGGAGGGRREGVRRGLRRLSGSLWPRLTDVVGIADTDLERGAGGGPAAAGGLCIGPLAGAGRRACALDGRTHGHDRALRGRHNRRRRPRTVPRARGGDDGLRVRDRGARALAAELRGRPPSGVPRAGAEAGGTGRASGDR